MQALLGTKLVGPLFELFIDYFDISNVGVPSNYAAASTLNDLADFL